MWFAQVHRVFPNGLASQEGTIQKGNEVLSINGKSLKGATHNDALVILRQARDPKQAVIVTRKPALEAMPDLNSSTDSTASASVASDVSMDSGKHPPTLGWGEEAPWPHGARPAVGCHVGSVTPRRPWPGGEGFPNPVPMLPLQQRPRCTR